MSGRTGARRLALAGSVLVLLALVVSLGAGPNRAGAEAPGELVVQPVLKSAAAGVEVLYGAGSPGEVWGAASALNVVVRHTEAEGWQQVPVGAPGGGPSADSFIAIGPQAGRTTPTGGLVLAAAGSRSKTLLVRDPGGGVVEVAPPPDELMLDAASRVAYEEATSPEEAGRIFGADGEELYPQPNAGGVKLAAIEESDGETGALVVPHPEDGQLQDGILHFDGESWEREPICVDVAPLPCQGPESARFRVVAVDAGGPGNAWLSGHFGSTTSGIELFAREGGEWRPQGLGAGLGGLFAVAQSEPSSGVTVGVGPREDENAQALTVTSSGVWIDVTLRSPASTGSPVDGTIYYDIGKREVTGSWCELADSPYCLRPLNSELPAAGRSFAWPPTSAAEPFGRRVVTGVGQGAMLSLSGEAFSRIAVAGGSAGAGLGAALSGPEEGWLGSAQGPLRLTRTPEAASLASWPVPFRRPLLAIAPAPGQPIGSLSSEALAVGADGQAARYLPGQGWIEEPFLTGSGARATPELRAIAWPEPSRAYAVGDNAAMWIWQRGTGLWEPDPAEPPNLYRANFTGIAFQPGEPDRGYAVGKQGVLLGYGRRWTQEALPPEVNTEVNFTSISFAGTEALAAYKFPESSENHYGGGLLVDEGSGWRTEPQLTPLLAEGSAPQLVAGLPDGGAVVVATRGEVLERESATAPWTKAGGPRLEAFPVALSAFREDGQIRALVSVETLKGRTGLGGLESAWSRDRAQILEQPPSDQAPLLTEPYVPGASGFLERQTPTGWRDEEHGLKPLPTPVFSGQGSFDLPALPEPIFALVVSPEGSEGWALGGQTGFDETQPSLLQTASVMRYGSAAASPDNEHAAPLGSEPKAVSFAVGGQAQCAGPCADLGGTGIGPDRWLKNATESAGAIGLAGGAAPARGVSAFIYTGSSVAEGIAGQISAAAFDREEQAYARRLTAGAGSPPVFATPSASDLDSSGTLDAFAAAFPGPPAGEGITAVARLGGSYSFNASGGGAARQVRVVVLDYSGATLSAEGQCWLGQQLEEAGSAGTPAIVVGNRDLDPAGESPNLAADATTVGGIVVTGEAQCPGGRTHGPGASAYFFDYPNQNRTYQLASGSRSIPVFGSGTLGYGRLPGVRETDYAGAAGYLLASVDVEARNPATNVAPVQVRLIPTVGELALDAEDGTLLRRSQVATFSALARRPQAGQRCIERNSPQPPGGCEKAPDPYIPIPSHCLGAKCSSTVFPSYRFSSSNPDIANFVEPDPASLEVDQPLLQNEETIPDETSGLLCAFNAGTTTVTIEAGGLAYSEPVTVQAGSVERPCGTVPLRNKPAQEQSVPLTPLAPTPIPTSHFTPGGGPVPAPPAPGPVAPAGNPAPAPVHIKPVKAPPHQPAPPFVATNPGIAPITVIVPPPPAPAVEPTPPSGTSPVTQPATSPEPQEEEEVAFDVVHHAVAVPSRGTTPAVLAASRGSHRLPTLALPALVLFAALGGVGIFGRRRTSPEPAFAQRNDRGGT